jgi:hypothetical protein
LCYLFLIARTLTNSSLGKEGESMRREIYKMLYELALGQVHKAAERVGLGLPAMVGDFQRQLAQAVEWYLWHCGVMTTVKLVIADIDGEPGRKYPRLAISVADVSSQARVAMERLTEDVPEGPFAVSIDDATESFRANRTRVCFWTTRLLES